MTIPTAPLSSDVPATPPNPAKQLARAYSSRSSLTLPSPIHTSPQVIGLKRDIPLHVEAVAQSNAKKLRRIAGIRPPANKIKGHSIVDNQVAADEFKFLLDSNTPLPPPSRTPQPRSSSIPPASQAAGSNTPHMTREGTLKPQGQSASILLQEAFRREYTPADAPAPDQSYSGVGDQDEVYAQHPHLLLGERPSAQIPSKISQRKVPNVKPIPPHLEAASFPAHGQSSTVEHALSSGLYSIKRKRTPLGTTHPLLLPGLGEGRSRNAYGKSLHGGVESGIGVIGGSKSVVARDERIHEVIEGDSCDVPMLRNPATLGSLRLIEGEETRYSVGAYTIDLDPDLPPTAVEHPVRVWNAILHALGANLQPMPRWTYERVMVEGITQAMWQATVTLILPRTHPVLVRHPLYHTVPQNQWTKEYAATVEALGGVKSFTGEPRKIKIDAQHSTMIQAIAKDVLSWMYAPTVSIVPATQDDEDDGEQLAMIVRPLQSSATATTRGVIVTGNHDLYQVQSATRLNSAPDSQRLVVHGYAEQAPMSAAKRMALLIEDLTSSMPGIPPRIRVEQGISSHCASFKTLYGYHVHIGPNAVKNNEATKRYVVDAIYETHAEAREACSQLALELNVEGFVRWLKDLLNIEQPKSPSQELRTTQFDIPEYGLNVAELGREGTFTIHREERVDWQALLNRFCETSGLGHPKYGQSFQKIGGQTLWIGKVIIEGEEHSAVFAKSNIPEARAEVARIVYCDHFGQEVE